MPKVPFEWLPGSWGLKGKTFEIAKAEYELTGSALERRLLEINKDTMSEKDYQIKVIEWSKKHGLINEIEYLRKLAELVEDETKRNLMMLDLDYREGKVKQLDYEKKSATLRGEPWVNVVEMNFGGNKSLEGSFELDWNEHFVESLKKEGYQGATPDSIVNQWFMEVCRNVALEEFDGTGNFTADSEANLEAVKRWSSEGRREYK